MKLKKLSDSLHRSVLGYPSTPRSDLTEYKVNQVLMPFGLHEAIDHNVEVNLPIPEGFGTWKQEVNEAVSAHTLETIYKLDSIRGWRFPEVPTNWQVVTGWQVWQNGRWRRIDKPVDNRIMFLDFEAAKRGNVWVPTCCIAMSQKGWLCWVADFDNLVTSVPFGRNNVVVGYNVQYDRSYLDIEYLQADSGNRFFDLMSAWIVCRGFSNQQRPVYSSDLNLDWKAETTTNGLAAVYKFYFGRTIDKSVRDSIIEGDLQWSRDNITTVLKYCCEDVLHTAELFQRLYPEYLQHRPSLISQSGAILLGSCWLPLDAKRYPQYYRAAEKQYQEIRKRTDKQLMVLTEAYAKELSGVPLDQLPKPALTLDWTPAKSGKNKGLPAWYRKVLSDHKKTGLTLSQRFVPIVLGLTWKDEPLLWDNKDQTWYTETYGWLPHPETRGKNVTSVFAKGFVSAFEDGVLSTNKEDAQELLKAKMSCVNWVSLRKRVEVLHTESPEGFPAALPHYLLVNGTITGRCADNLWQVAANPRKSRIGTELKSMVAPPPGYVFVGADVDGQEAWLAGILGDSRMGVIASTPMSAVCHVGIKAKTLKESTDIHSIMANETGMTRDLTKNRVYGKIYGQGISGDTNYYLKSMPRSTVDEAKANALLFERKFKGDKRWNQNVLGQSKSSYHGGLASDTFNVMEAIADSKTPRTPLTKAVLTKALAGNRDYKPSRVNWVIQSSGVDFRDLLVLLTRHFYQKLGIDGRLIITIHDEIRTMVREGQEVIAAYALQLAQLYCRAAFIDALGLDCIPAGIAYFSAVDIDPYCLRKDPSDPQVTPSQPDGLPLGYTLSPPELNQALQMI